MKVSPVLGAFRRLGAQQPPSVESRRWFDLYADLICVLQEAGRKGRMTIGFPCHGDARFPRSLDLGQGQGLDDYPADLAIVCCPGAILPQRLRPTPLLGRVLSLVACQGAAVCMHDMAQTWIVVHLILPSTKELVFGKVSEQVGDADAAYLWDTMDETHPVAWLASSRLQLIIPGKDDSDQGGIDS